MPLDMNCEVFITCGVTGSGGTQDRSPHVPRSPEQIAAAAVDAGKAGAAVVHCHVRDPETGQRRRDLHLYREVTERIRAADVDVGLNLTAGTGGDRVFGDVEQPLPLRRQGTEMGGASNRVEHIRHVMAQFGPCLAWPWTKLMDVPELNDELVDLIASQSDERSSRWSIRELEAIRDGNLVAVMEALARQNGGQGWGAGALQKDYLAQLKAAADAQKA